MSDENSSPDDYFAEIESHFAYRRGTPFLFSGKDWALLKSWHEENIPLAVVLEAIDACFDSREKSERKGVVSSLSYCRHAVIEQIAVDREVVHRVEHQADAALDSLVYADAEIKSDARDKFTVAESVVPLSNAIHVRRTGDRRPPIPRRGVKPARKNSVAIAPVAGPSPYTITA